jgi:peptidyl-prolyl cis-trans isomerase B (cyclophilin B)
VPTNQQRREAAKRKLERQQERRVQRSQHRKRATVVTVVVVVLVVVAAVVSVSLLSGGGQPPPPGADQAAPSSAPSSPPPGIPTQVAPPPKRPQALPATVSCAYPSDDQPPARPARPPATANISARGTDQASLATSAGTIGLVLDRSLAPCTVNSFVNLVKQGYYDNTPCHRLTTSPGLQVLQCGDPSGTGSGGPGYKFADEVFPQLTYGRGYLAMANAGPNTNGSQFFMIYGDASALTPKYTVFGTIAPAGLQVLDTIAKAGDDGSNGPGDGKPNTHVVITKATAG